MGSAPPQPHFTGSSTTAFPILAGVDLNPAEEQLIDFWLSGAGDLLRRWPSREILPGRLHRGLNYFPTARPADLSELLQCYRPLLVLLGNHPPAMATVAGTGSGGPHPASHQSAGHPGGFRPGPRSSYKLLFEQGIAACWPLPAPGDPIVFPDLSRPRSRGQAFLIEDDPVHRSILRQLLYFAGYDVRADQPGLESLRPEFATGTMPALILANLDAAHMDIPTFFHRLNAFLKQHPGRGPRVLLTKDFDRPGLDVRTIEHTVRPHAARIFHPREAMLVLLEALFLAVETSTGGEYPVDAIGQAGSFRTIDELLFRKNVRLRESAPPIIGLDRLRGQERIAPFVWLYECLAQDAGRGAILNPRDHSQ
jgi:CheY-like chemotaxis protein